MTAGALGGKAKPIPKELLSALRRIEISTARLANEQLVGSYSSSFKGQGLAFQEVRPYQPGDDIRTIDWNVSARMNEPFIKKFVEEREMTVMLVVDLSRSMLFGTKRAAKAHVASEITALVSFSAIKNGDRVGLILGGHESERVVAPKKGEKHVLRVLREVLGAEFGSASEQPAVAAPASAAAQGMGAHTPLRQMLEQLVRITKRRSITFVVSDFFATDYDRVLAIAARKHDVIPVVLSDPRDMELPNVGLVWVEDLETGESRLVDTGDASVRKMYKSAAEKHKRERLRVFGKLGLDVVHVTTGGPFVEPFRELFQRRAKRSRSR